MRPLSRILRLMLQDQKAALLRGAALAFAVLVMGIALLGLSGWFITAAAAAGLAGLGAVFDVFRPSASVRFLALGRTAARYGERLLTHDATLRALETLRLRLLEGFLAAPHDRMIRIRGSRALNRLTADVDALDGLPLRLVLPLMAGFAAQFVTFAVLWRLVGLSVALWLFCGWLAAAAGIMLLISRRALPLSRRAEAAAQAIRTRMIDMIRARPDLAVYGLLADQAASVANAQERHLGMRLALDRIDRRTGLAIGVASAVLSAGALWIGLALVEQGRIAPAFAALGFFAALALLETVVPIRRALSDLGRMTDAARRVVGGLPPAHQGAARCGHLTGQGLLLSDVAVARPGGGAGIVAGLSLAVAPGETVALTGPSGSGKSVLLLAAAGLHPLNAGRIVVGGTDLSDLPEPELRDHLTLVPQRTALMSGTVAEALRLGASAASEQALWDVLDVVQMTAVVKSRGGLAFRIGARGAGLSGGEARRIALARALLRHPDILLLDEPTEGLDEATAHRVLAGLRAYLPKAAILMASHREVETRVAHRIIPLR